MMLRLGPVLYDLRRSVLNIYVLVLLVLAVLSGVGFTYMIRGMLLQGGASLSDINFMGNIVVYQEKLYFLGIAFDSRGDVLRDARVKIYVGNTSISDVRLVRDGVLYVEKNLTDILGELQTTPIGGVGTPLQPPRIGLGALPPPIVEISRGSIVLNITPANYRFITYTSETGIVSPVLVVNYRVVSPYVSSLRFPHNAAAIVSIQGVYVLDFIVLSIGRDSVVTAIYGFKIGGDKQVTPLNTLIKYNISSVTSAEMVVGPVISVNIPPPSIESFNRLNMIDYEVFTEFFKVAELSIPKPIRDKLYNGYLILGLGDNTTDPNSYDSYAYSVFLRFPQIILAAAFAMPASSGIMLSLFTIAVVYLSNRLMARPRSSGELEFILSKPVTRRDLFINRFLAQVIALLIMIIVFIVVFQISSISWIGTGYDTNLLLRLFSGVFLSVLAFSSLVYAVATSLRPSFYMGVSITLYIVFILFWDTLMSLVAITVYGLNSFQEISNFVDRSMYFNPRIANRLFIDLIQNYLTGASLNLDIPYAIIAIVLWIVLPLLPAYYRFKRVPLYT